MSDLTNLKPASEHLEFNIAIIPQEHLKASLWTGAFGTAFISPYISTTCQHTLKCACKCKCFLKQKREEKLEEHIRLLQLLINGAIIKSDHLEEEDNSKLVTENLLSCTQMLRVQKSEAVTEPAFMNGKQWLSCVATVAPSPQSPPLNNGGDGAEKMFGFKASTSEQITVQQQQ